MFFSFSFVSWGQIFAVFLAPIPEEGISDYIAHSPIIRVLTVWFPPKLVRRAAAGAAYLSTVSIVRDESRLVDSVL